MGKKIKDVRLISIVQIILLKPVINMVRVTCFTGFNTFIKRQILRLVGIEYSYHKT